MSKFKKHSEKWKSCKKCRYYKTRKTKPLLFKGKIPCNVLFIGSFPGDSEEVLKKLFCGPSGIFLNELINSSSLKKMRIGFTYLVSCRPRDLEGDRINKAESECVEKCSPRLEEIVEISKPKAIVCLGREVGKAIENSNLDLESIDLFEINSLYRLIGMDVSHKEFMIQQTIDMLDQVAESIIPF